MIRYGCQNIDDADVDAVTGVLRSDYLTTGPKVPEFELGLQKIIGVEYALAANSGTAALHLSCLGLDLGQNDRLWTTPISFVASANCGRYCGAEVDFCDIDPDSWNIDAEALEKKLETASVQNMLPKILVVVHFAGVPCEMEKISELARYYGVSVIEDASHALGATYRGQAVGDCMYSDTTVFSFHPVKLITTAEGGAITTAQRDLYDSLALLRTHGITRNKDQMIGEVQGPWIYEQLALGYNYRMNDLSASLGVSQLNRLETFIRRRQQIAQYYSERFRELPITTQRIEKDMKSAHHLYVVRLQVEKVEHERKRIFEYMREQGIGVNVHYIPIHLQPYYRDQGHQYGDYPKSEEFYKGCLSLPIHPSLTDAEVETVAETFVRGVR